MVDLLSHLHLHPMVVHFPIALFITASGLEILSLILKRDSLHQTALSLYVIAALTTPLAVGAGIWEEKHLNLSHRILDLHKCYAFWAMWVSLASLPVLYMLKTAFKKYFRVLFIVFLISVSGLIAMSAAQGGKMVYEYGVGVEE